MFREIRAALDGSYRRQAQANAVAGFVTGLLVGAIGALLLAPKSGKEMRADIAEGAKIGAEKVKDVSQKIAESAKELSQKTADTVKDKYQAFKEKKDRAADAAAEPVVEKAPAAKAESKK